MNILFSIFLQYFGLFFLIFLEIKCCKEESGLNSKRKKSASQLRGHIVLLKNATHFSMNVDQLDKINLISVWPYLSSKEKCNNPQCELGVHNRFKDKPVECLLPGSSQAPQYDATIKHWFKDDIDELETILRGIVLDPNHAMEKKAWLQIMKIHTTLACGALYDETNKTFFLLGPNQVHLIKSTEHDLLRPKLIMGTAGTGKTITIAAKIEQLYKEGHISSNRRALFICYSIHLKDYMSMLLKNVGIRSENVVLVNASDPKNVKFRKLLDDPVKTTNLFLEENFSFIFMDEAEDDNDNEIIDRLKSWTPVSVSLKGIFWIMYDPYQSNWSKNQHFLLGTSKESKVTKVKAEDEPLNSTGNQLTRLTWAGNMFNKKESDFDIITLESNFRLTLSNAQYIKDANLLPEYKVNMSHDITGMGVTVRNVMVEAKEFFLRKLEESLLSEIGEASMIESFQKNIHPGDITFLLPETDYKLHFGQQIDTFLKNLNEKLKDKFVKSMVNLGLQPEFTSDVSQSVLFEHHKDIKKCRCKIFIGRTRDLKGLTSQVVYYIPIVLADERQVTEIDKYKDII